MRMWPQVATYAQSHACMAPAQSHGIAIGSRLDTVYCAQVHVHWYTNPWMGMGLSQGQDEAVNSAPSHGAKYQSLCCTIECAPTHSAVVCCQLLAPYSWRPLRQRMIDVCICALNPAPTIWPGCGAALAEEQLSIVLLPRTVVDMQMQ